MSDDEPEVREVIMTPAVRAALAWLVHVDLVEVFQRRASVMKSVPKFLTGAFRIALRIALHEAVLGGDEGEVVRQTRGWKLLLLLPRRLLSKPPRGGLIGKEKLAEEVPEVLQIASGRICSGSVLRIWPVFGRRQSRRNTCSEAKRGERAFMFAQLGEFSSARQGLEGAELAAGKSTDSPGLETTTCTVQRTVAR